MTSPTETPRTVEYGTYEADYVREYLFGYQSAVAWLATGAPRAEADRMSDIHVDLRAGGEADCSTFHLDADDYPSFLAHVQGTIADRDVYDGRATLRKINARQGTNHPSWPVRCFAVSFDDAIMSGFLTAVHQVVNL